jgi:NADPH:quinone reductase-like Zn-dependent oxidoreductase
VISDPVAGPLLEKLAEAAAIGGIVFEYGWLSMRPTPFPLLTALGKGLSIRGYSLTEITRNPEKLPAANKCVYDRLADRRFHAKVARIFPFAQTARRRLAAS